MYMLLMAVPNSISVHIYRLDLVLVRVYDNKMVIFALGTVKYGLHYHVLDRVCVHIHVNAF